MHNKVIKQGHFGFLSALGWLRHFTPKLQSSQNAAYVRRYELSAMRFIGTTLMIFSSWAFASGGPKEVTLTPELAKTLGFTIKVKPEGPAIMIEMQGPIESPSGCPATRSGSFLLDSNGEELFVYITELPKSNSMTEAVGYYTNKSHEMGVFIDYLCKGTKVLQSIRYSVPSIRNWLITRPSN